MDASKVPVSLRALHQRINRKLAPQEEVLKKARGVYARAQFGNYYVLHWRSNHVRHWHVDPVKWGRELGVLAAWEVVEDEVSHDRSW